MVSQHRLSRVLLVFVVLCSCFLDFWEYSRQTRANPDSWMDIIHGTADAPQQYRILLPKAAWFLQTHLHLGFRHSFALFDFVALLLTGFILLRQLERSAAFQAADNSLKLCARIGFLFLLGYYLAWLLWYQRPETLPTALFIAAVAAIWSSRPKGAAQAAAFLLANLACVLMQALMRADVAVCLFAGIALFSLLPAGRRLPLSRTWSVAIAGMCVLLAIAVQWTLMHRIYPGATYGTTAVVQLRENLHPLNLLTFLLFMMPVGWTLANVRKAQAETEAPWLAIALGALFFIPIWATVGRIAEVRIFMPFAIALVPLTVSSLLIHAPGSVD